MLNKDRIVIILIIEFIFVIIITDLLLIKNDIISLTFFSFVYNTNVLIFLFISRLLYSETNSLF